MGIAQTYKLGYLLLRKREVPEQRSLPLAIMAILSPRRSASSLQDHYLQGKGSGDLHPIQQVTSHHRPSLTTTFNTNEFDITTHIFFTEELELFRYYYLHEMRCKQYCSPSFMFGKEVPCSSSGIGIHTGSRLIKNDYFRSPNQSYSHTDSQRDGEGKREGGGARKI